MKSAAITRQPSQSIRNQIRIGMVVAFAVPLVLSCAFLVWHTARDERQAVTQRLLNHARISASMIEPIALTRTNLDPAALLNALESRNPSAMQAMQEWSAVVMASIDAVGVALLDAHGEVLSRWPKKVAIDFAVPNLDARLGHHVYPIAEASLHPTLTVAVVPIDRGPQRSPIAYVSIAVVDRGVFAVAIKRTLPVAAVLLMFAIFGATILNRVLSKYIISPLTAIARMLSRSKQSDGIELGELASAELEQIASQFARLQEELQEAKRQSVVMERRAESNVAEETRRFKSLLSRARKDAEHDALTGLTNRRFIEERLEPIFEEQINHNVNMVIAMFDVDNFKPLNDTEGHAAGDRILRFFGELLRGALREDDVGVRYGGDEFAAILMDISGSQALDICDRIVKLFNQQIASMDIQTKVTLSSGFASQVETGARTASELLSQADAALYKAKRGGKSQVVGA